MRTAGFGKDGVDERVESGREEASSGGNYGCLGRTVRRRYAVPAGATEWECGKARGHGDLGVPGEDLACENRRDGHE